MLEAGTAYGVSELGAGEAVNVEYVSANPTGPLHVGHGRGAVFGDALAALLEKAGFAVTREYYINDAGAQLEALARSVFYRYRQALGEEAGAPPEGFYPGDYLIPVGERLAERDGAAWLEADEPARMAECADFGRDSMMALIREDLSALGVRQDTEVSERNLHRDGAVEAALAELNAQGLIYNRRARSAQGQDAGGLGAATANALPRQPIRRRQRPRAQEIGRRLDLLRLRHRLSPRQVRARLRHHDRRLGRRPRRLRQAHEGGGGGGKQRPKRRSTSRSARWSTS